MELILEKWDEILRTVKEEYEISDIAFDTFLKPLSVYSIEDMKLYILVPSEQIGVNYISKRYTLPIKVAVAEITGIEYEIEFILPEQTKSMKSFRSKSPEFIPNTDKTNLNPNYTFDTFVVGENNKFAHAASLAVAECPGQVYNPLYIYGGPGLGKTHLMQSIGHFILKQQPEKKVLYVTSEEFTNEVIDSIRNGNASAMTKLRDKYRTVDVLMIDDVQFIIGKESTQEEFFHTFNVLHSAGKQIILSSDKPPKEMETLEERIRSRFEWGLLADVGYPDYETRMAILRRKEEVDGFHLDDQILDYIATNIKSNIRELEGALNKLLAFSNLEHTDITMEIAVRELQNIISPDKPREITPQLVIEIVAEHFNISTDQMISKNRSNEIARPRQIAMYLCKNMTDTPLETIGALLGGRDHSTIIHGIKKITGEYETNETSHNLIETIKKKINPN
ncbi:chromosomal replication initiator protein DnaA [Roseburia sp. MSJ-14]|uniref:chromosomal replication initiator protein DnaA n=1 Tax=Roseburia sp. MSJ-14 TaxID=2841514 RepID=UPI001C116039|nr:chromosomal replication initiator protein DnaA [Roseburia sp. MSJ-14]MBU5474214.1 chromosomal replication initiator protein DnaA [Roseburia sp. MSJ-14]